MKEKMNKKRSKTVTILIQLAIGAVIGFFMGIFLGKVLFSKMSEGKESNLFLIILQLVGAVILFFVLSLFHIILHEAGHLIMGLRTGYTFVSFRVGSTTIIKENGKFKRKKFDLPGTAGQCLMAPPAIKKSQFPFQLYNYGGVVMNFITAVAAIGLLLLFPNMPKVLFVILLLFAITGIILGLTNAIPMKVSGIANDGLNVRSMKKDINARKAFHLQLDLNAKQSLGLRMKDIPKEYFQLPEDADLTNVLISYVKLMEYYRYLDLMDFVTAKECLRVFEPLIDKLPTLYATIIRMEQLFLELIQDNKKEVAEHYLTNEVKAFMKAAKNEMNVKRITYTYELLYKNDSVAAEKCYIAAQALAKKYPVQAEADTNLMLMEYVKNIGAPQEEIPVSI